MKPDLVTVYDRLMENCRAAGFAGYDPFDGLESRVFQATQLRSFRASRLAWQQFVKRSPINLRPLLVVPKGVNAKGLALFALAELARWRVDGDPNERGHLEGLLDHMHRLRIETLTANGVEFDSYGYNFDWQSRAFFAPKGTPTIVPTAFAVRAMGEARQMSGRTMYDETLLKIGRFVTEELNRSYETDDEVCFSYTPVDTTRIYNATLLAAEVLATVNQSEGSNRGLIEKAVRFVLKGQRDDGSWLYGPGEIHGWVDNFHTAFVLDSLRRISDRVPETESKIGLAMARGFEYWIANFFLEDGTPKYFDKRTYPIDVHSAAAAIVTLAGFAKRDERALPLARKIADWTIANMIGPDGNTYYQKRRFHTVKTPFIRWGQAWTAYALASLIEAEHENEGS